MKLAIVDDGICREEFSMPIETVCIGKKVDKKTFYQDDHYSHATVITKIILKYCRPESITDIVFLNKDDSADISDLCSALEYCLEKNFDVINLSCGIEKFDKESDLYHRLVSVCRKLYEKNTVIYSAQNNYGNITVPANFPYTVSVENNEKIKSRFLSLYRRSDIYTTGSHDIRINKKVITTSNSNSYACAYAVSQHFVKNPAKDVEYSPLFTADLSFFYMKAESRNGRYFELYLKNNEKPAGRIYTDMISSSEKKYLKKHKLKYWSIIQDSFTEKLIMNCDEFIDDKYDVPIVKIKEGHYAGETALNLYHEFKRLDYSAEIITTSLNNVVYNEMFIPGKYLKKYSKILSLYNSTELLIVITDEKNISDEDELEITVNKNGKYMLVSEKTSTSVNNIADLTEKIINYYS